MTQPQPTKLQAYRGGVWHDCILVEDGGDPLVLFPEGKGFSRVHPHALRPARPNRNDTDIVTKYAIRSRVNGRFLSDLSDPLARDAELGALDTRAHESAFRKQYPNQGTVYLYDISAIAHDVARNTGGEVVTITI